MSPGPTRSNRVHRNGYFQHANEFVVDIWGRHHEWFYRIAYKAGIVAPADCNTSGAGITLIAEGDITGTSHQVTGLTTTETYSFRLCSINPIPLTPAQSAGVTATGTTAAFLGSASAKGKHIYASWSNGISPYVASIYSDNACTNLMKSTGSTVEVEALFAEFSVPGTYKFLPETAENFEVDSHPCVTTDKDVMA